MKLLANDVSNHILSDSSSAGTMTMVINFIEHFLFAYSNAHISIIIQALLAAAISPLAILPST